MSYRREFNKVSIKISQIAQKGQDGKFEYFEYIDELIDSGKYSLLEDVMNTKFKIDIRKYMSITDFKKQTYDKVRQVTNSLFQIKLKKLFDDNQLYPIGFSFYDKPTNHYLGDIKEVEQIEPYILYKDPKLVEKQDQDRIINLEVTSGLPDSVLNAIPTFEADPTTEIPFTSGDYVRYNTNIYECAISYTYNFDNQILPTDTNYWMQIFSPTYSLTLIDDDSTKLLDKYKEAILIVKSFIYSNPSLNETVDSNYIDDYFE